MNYIATEPTAKTITTFTLSYSKYLTLDITKLLTLPSNDVGSNPLDNLYYKITNIISGINIKINELSYKEIVLSIRFALGTYTQINIDEEIECCFYRKDILNTEYLTKHIVCNIYKNSYNGIYIDETPYNLMMNVSTAKKLYENKFDINDFNTCIEKIINKNIKHHINKKNHLKNSDYDFMFSLVCLQSFYTKIIENKNYDNIDSYKQDCVDIYKATQVEKIALQDYVIIKEFNSIIKNHHHEKNRR